MSKYWGICQQDQLRNIRFKVDDKCFGILLHSGLPKSYQLKKAIESSGTKISQILWKQNYNKMSEIMKIAQQHFQWPRRILVTTMKTVYFPLIYQVSTVSFLWNYIFSYSNLISWPNVWQLPFRCSIKEIYIIITFSTRWIPTKGLTKIKN